MHRHPSSYMSSATSNGEFSDEELDEQVGVINSVHEELQTKSDSEGSAGSTSASDCDDADSLYLNNSEKRRIRQMRNLKREARKEARRLRAEREAWTISGQLENEMQYTLKSWNTLQKGTIRVSFHDGFVDYTMPQVQVSENPLLFLKRFQPIN